MRVAAVVVAVAAFAAAGTASATTPPRVTVISDSVLAPVEWNAAALATLERGFDVQLEIGICRTIAGESCPFDGERVPTLLDLIGTLGAGGVGSTVVIELGYNDPPAASAERVEEAVNALRAAGVQRILWLTLHEGQAAFAATNAALAAVAQALPGVVTLVDWDAAARDHPEWFQEDGVHLLEPGVEAIAAEINGALVQAFAPPRPAAQTLPPITIDDSPLPIGKEGARYSAWLRARGGRAGLLRWSLPSGPLIEGLHLRPDGLIFGTPRQQGRQTLVARVVDATGRSASRLIHLQIGG